MSTKRTSATHNTAYKQVMSQYGKRKFISPSPSLKEDKLRTLEKRRKLFSSLKKQAKALGLKLQPAVDSPTSDVQTTPTTNPLEVESRGSTFNSRRETASVLPSEVIETDAGNDNASVIHNGNHISPPFQVIALGGVIQK